MNTGINRSSLIALAAFALLGVSATAANAVFVQGFGAGTAIPGVADRTATFDSVVTGTNLSNYSENLLSITVPSNAFAGFDPTSGNGGFSGGFHYPSGGAFAFTVLTTTDATSLFAVELSAGNGFSSTTTNFYYEAFVGANIISSGAFQIASGSVVTFSDTDGFEGIRMGAYSTLAEAQSGNSTVLNALALDNVRVNVGAVAVPESGTVALILPALGIVGMVVSRRLKK